MSFQHTVSVLLIGLLLSGCATFQANRADVAERIDTLLADGNYREALNTIDLVRETHPEFRRLQTWRTTIADRAAAAEQNLMDEVEAQMRAGQWRNATTQLSEASLRLPDSARLSAARERVARQRSELTGGLQLDLLLARASGLPAEIAALDKLHEATAKGEALGAELAARRATLAATRQGLLDCGRAALEQRRSEQAITCLDAAHGVAADAESSALLKRARAKETAAEERTTATRKRTDKQRQNAQVASLQAALRDAQQRDDLGAARTHLDALLAVAPTEDLRRESGQLKARIMSRVEKGLSTGRRQYTAGDIQGARTTWVETSLLAPDNEELKSSIARAERVLKKLQTLSTDQNP